MSNRPDPSLHRNELIEYFDALAPERDRWIAKNSYYHQQLRRIFSFYISPDHSVLEVGSGTGNLLAALKPKRGVGIDLSSKMVEAAAKKYPELEFRVDDVENLQTKETFDYIVLSDVSGFLYDVQAAFENLHRISGPRTRIVISHYSYLWDPILRLGETLGLKAKQPVQNWLARADIENLLQLAGFEVIRANMRLMLPVGIPLLAPLCNRLLVNLPGFRHLGLVSLLVARPKQVPYPKPLSCSVVVPCRNERGNIEGAVTRTPEMGTHTELIFVEGNSSDGTYQECERVIAAYPDKDIKLISQGTGKGKGDAVRKGFAAATGDVLMILDADLTVAPEEMPKFFNALAGGMGEFVHGSRLIYPMQSQAMQLLNSWANKFFGLAFTFTLEQRFKDTLCGTKVLLKTDYEKIVANRSYFGDFDPFGDFDLIFGAAKLNLKIVEIPIHYLDRAYGSTNISRFRHGWLLLQMVWFALWKMKFV
jgi:SAM-dependent methyltransferase